MLEENCGMLKEVTSITEVRVNRTNLTFRVDKWGIRIKADNGINVVSSDLVIPSSEGLTSTLKKE
jgi:hypothetical protein